MTSSGVTGGTTGPQAASRSATQQKRIAEDTVRRTFVLVSLRDKGLQPNHNGQHCVTP